MKSFVLKTLLTAALLLYSPNLVEGVLVTNYWVALLTALAIGFVNGTLGWLLHLITTPFRWLTLGLLYFVINGAMILLVESWVEGFHVPDFWAAFWIAVMLWVANLLLGLIFDQKD